MARPRGDPTGCLASRRGSRPAWASARDQGDGSCRLRRGHRLAALDRPGRSLCIWATAGLGAPVARRRLAPSACGRPRASGATSYRQHIVSVIRPAASRTRPRTITRLAGRGGDHLARLGAWRGRPRSTSTRHPAGLRRVRSSCAPRCRPRRPLSAGAAWRFASGQLGVAPPRSGRSSSLASSGSSRPPSGAASARTASVCRARRRARPGSAGVSTSGDALVSSPARPCPRAPILGRVHRGRVAPSSHRLAAVPLPCARR